MLQLVIDNTEATRVIAPGIGPNGFCARTFAQWNVTATGDYAADCATGAALADDLIQYIRAGGLPATLSHTIASIAKRGGDLSGIEIGYLHRIASMLQ